jgi:hypothetical protein
MAAFRPFRPVWTVHVNRAPRGPDAGRAPRGPDANRAPRGPDADRAPRGPDADRAPRGPDADRAPPRRVEIGPERGRTGTGRVPAGTSRWFATAVRPAPREEPGQQSCR